MSRRGITLLEVLTVLAIIGLLLALLVPAVVSARESARRTQCQSNLRQFGIAIHAYHGDYGLFPPGNARGFSFLVPLLPYLDQAPLLTAPIPPSHYVGWPDDHTPKIQFLASHNPPFLACPSDPFVRPGSAMMPEGLPLHPTNYAANFGTGVQTYGYNGAFVNVAGGMFSTAGFTDGLSNTAAVSEILVTEPVDPQPRTFARSIWRTSPPCWPQANSTFLPIAAARRQPTGSIWELDILLPDEDVSGRRVTPMERFITMFCSPMMPVAPMPAESRKGHIPSPACMPAA